MKISKSDLIFIIEDSQYELSSKAAQQNKIQLHVSDEVSWTRNKSLKLPNTIFRIKFKKGLEDLHLKKIIRQIKNKNAPQLLMTGPASYSRDLHNHLLKNGFKKAFEASGMAIDLNHLNINFRKPAELGIKIVKDMKILCKWSEIVALGLFGDNKTNAKKYGNIFRPLMKNDIIKCFIGFRKGKPVACSALFIYQNTAGLFYVAVLDKYRNKGIGRQISLAPLLYARDLGYEIGVLQASSLGEVIYKKIGFKKYCRLRRYRYDPDAKLGK